MKTNRLCGIIGLIVLAASVMGDERPNLVFMIADDCTYLDMEVYGGQAKTPNLNQLAREGMQFSRCFQAAPMCWVHVTVRTPELEFELRERLHHRWPLEAEPSEDETAPTELGDGVTVFYRIRAFGGGSEPADRR